MMSFNELNEELNKAVKEGYIPVRIDSINKYLFITQKESLNLNTGDVINVEGNDYQIELIYNNGWIAAEPMSI